MAPRRFTNWGRTFSCEPSSFAKPESESDVIELVRSARNRHQHVKVVGAGHSWSDIAMTDGVLVSLDRMGQFVRADRERGTATVGGGIRLEELTAELDRRGLALPILGSISEQSIAGATATGTHGSSVHWGNLSTLIRAMRFVSAGGEVVELREGDERLAGARVHLGALGLVTQMEVTVQGAFNLVEVQEPTEWDDFLRRCDEIFRSAEYVKAWWLPHTETVQVFRYERTEEPAERRVAYDLFDEHVLNGLVFPVFLRGGRARPERIPAINRLLAKTAFQPARRVCRSDQAFNLAMPAVHRETEYAFELGRTAEALEALRRLIDREGLRVNFITELRAVAADDSWMSPAYGRETCQLGAYCGWSRDCDRYFEGVRELMRDFDGRPHWGKEMHVDAVGIERAYPKARDFRRWVFELDPDGIFSNQFLDRVLGAQRRRPS